MTDRYRQVDPIVSPGFWMEIDSVAVATFTGCKGLEVTTQHDTINEGGRNDNVVRLPTRTELKNITLTRGWTSNLDLLSWYAEVVSGRIRTRNCSIVMGTLNGQNPGTELARISLEQAYPVKWVGPAFSIPATGAGESTIETLELAFVSMRVERGGAPR